MADRVKTWTAEILTSSDLNAEFDNIWANVSHTPTGTWTFTKSGTPITIQPSSAPAANTKLLAINNAAATELMSVDYEGDAYVKNTLKINDTSDADVTVGITINQGAADDLAISLKSSDVAHGVTGILETDTYFGIKKAVAASGGAVVYGVTEASIGMQVVPIETTNDTTKGTAATGAFMVNAVKKSGTSVGAMDANSNLMTVGANSGVLFILDADGDSHQDVGTAWTNFDDHDDPALLEALSLAVSRPGDPIRTSFNEFLKYNRESLEKAKLVKFNEDGHHFVNMSRLAMLLTGAIRQLAGRIAMIERKLVTA